MPIAFIALGSNLGDRGGYLVQARWAIDALPNTCLQAASHVYQTPPMGPSGQRPYLNAVVQVSTQLDPVALLHQLQRIEAEAGRQRGEHWGPRTLDLDLLLYDDLVTDGPPLALPREDVLKYDFVLGPLAELAPDLVHPVDGRRLAELWEAFEDGGRRLTVEDVDVEARV